jgi:hypothetical protein
MVYIGFDNGVTSQGIGVITHDMKASLFPLPVKREASYTKEEKFITRVNYKDLVKLLKTIKDSFPKNEKFSVAIERPMVNSRRFNATLSAIRCLEATIIALEMTGFNFSYIDSKEWQRVLLPGDIKGSDELKKASLIAGKQLYPYLTLKKDADGILIAEYLRIKDSRQL